MPGQKYEQAVLRAGDHYVLALQRGIDGNFGDRFGRHAGILFIGDACAGPEFSSGNAGKDDGNGYTLIFYLFAQRG